MSKNPKKRESVSSEYNFTSEELADRVIDSMRIFATAKNGEIIPSAQDGLKEVQRRILYAAYELKLYGNSARKEKVSRVTGDTMGKFHPHGDISIGNAIVKLGQAHYIHYPLFTAQGDFGSQETGGSAAARYLECKISDFAYEVFLQDMMECKECVMYQKSYADNGDEPIFLPAKLPMVLIHGTVSIGGGGYASNVPPHTLKSVVDATVEMLDNPDITNDIVSDMLRIDYPTAGIVVNAKAIKARYKTDNPRVSSKDVSKSVRLRSKVIYDEENYSAEIVELPHGVTVESVMESISNLKDKTNRKRYSEVIDNMLYDVVDGSGKVGISIIIKGREGVDIRNLVYKLFSASPLETCKPLVFCLLKDGYPDDTYNILRIIQEWYSFRHKTLIRKFRLMLAKYREQLQILEGKIICFDRLPQFQELITTSNGRADIIKRLIKEMGLNELQAYRVSEMKVYQLSQMDRKAVGAERKSLLAKADATTHYTYGTLNKKGKVVKTGNDNIKEYIRSEIIALQKKYTKKPTTKLENISLSTQAVHPNIDYILTLQDNYISKKEIETIRTTNRGTKGVKTQMSNNSLAQKVNNNDLLIMFTNMGRSYRTYCYDIIPNVKHLLGNFIPMVPGEKVVSIIAVPKDTNEDENDDRVVIVTTLGQVKANYLNTFQSCRRDATSAITLEEDEEVFGAMICDANKNLVLATNSGHGLMYPVDDITVHKSRSSKGMKAIKDLKGSHVIGACIVTADDVNKSSIALIKADGYGKRIKLSELTVKKRGGALNIIIKCDKDNMLVSLLPINKDAKKIRIYSNSKMIELDMSSIPALSRVSSGRKLMNLETGDSVKGAILV